ncbi:hypothetical protein [Streptomyces sp. NPDC059788]|uniref:hypothetical protein n=1 Tax=Streptomyces sp. NPDC059788 TaxID=3346948 RepID=UPI0036533FD8
MSFSVRRYTDAHAPTNRSYIVGFHGGHSWYVKAGKATSDIWVNRVTRHHRIARVHRYVTTGLWVLPWLDLSQIHRAETRVLNSLYTECMRFAHSHAIPEEDRHGFQRDGEYFIGMHFDEVEPVAEGIIRNRADRPM